MSARSRSLSTTRSKSSARQTAVRAPAHCRAHHFWMVATLLAFPSGLSLATFIGLGSVVSFLAGAICSLLVLLLNILVEHEFWMLDVHWRTRFEDPDFSHRLLVVSGALLLIIQTGFLLMFVVDQSLASKIFYLLMTSRA